jgi:hypothetical protein
MFRAIMEQMPVLPHNHRRALKVLAGSPDGMAEALLAHCFTVELLAALVDDKFATASGLSNPGNSRGGLSSLETLQDGYGHPGATTSASLVAIPKGDRHSSRTPGPRRDSACTSRLQPFNNSRRPHSSLDGFTPDQAYFNPLPLRLAA